MSNISIALFVCSYICGNGIQSKQFHTWLSPLLHTTSYTGGGVVVVWLFSSTNLQTRDSLSLCFRSAPRKLLMSLGCFWNCKQDVFIRPDFFGCVWLLCVVPKPLKRTRFQVGKVEKFDSTIIRLSKPKQSPNWTTKGRSHWVLGRS